MAESKWTRESFERVFREYVGDENTPSAKKRARILKVATELFVRQGYRKTSVDDIARRAEVAKGTVYLYFENKAALLVMAIALEKKKVLDRLEPLFKGSIPEAERLHFYLGLVFTISRELPLSARVATQDAELMAALEEIGEARMAESQARGEGLIVELIELAAPGVFDDEEKRLRADVIIGLAVFGAMMTKDWVLRGRSFDEFAATLTDMLTYGIIHRPPKDAR